ncbi:hypothetical protein Pcinc_039781 [Petrolisthes cinctipes]|uniref:Uncharacterized protein n=1 Tax=Petrolisthes cinctipes TaxID=88211 RepID=A0AAE1BRP7_PETCI|nr:hypothetical protein Pcinc_039781 [Petrolisthes cinctipes]
MKGKDKKVGNIVNGGDTEVKETSRIVWMEGMYEESGRQKWKPGGERAALNNNITIKTENYYPHTTTLHTDTTIVSVQCESNNKPRAITTFQKPIKRVDVVAIPQTSSSLLLLRAGYHDLAHPSKT